MGEQFIITDGDYHEGMPVGPFASEADAHAYYQSNQPHPKEHPYVRPPTIVRLLRPAPGHPRARAATRRSLSRRAGQTAGEVNDEHS